METRVINNLPFAQPVPLPSIPDPDDVKFIFQLCILEAMTRSWEIFAHTLREIAKESARLERVSRKKRGEIHRVQLLAEYMRVLEKVMAQFHMHKPSSKNSRILMRKQIAEKIY